MTKMTVTNSVRTMICGENAGTTCTVGGSLRWGGGSSGTPTGRAFQPARANPSQKGPEQIRAQPGRRPGCRARCGCRSRGRSPRSAQGRGRRSRGRARPGARPRRAPGCAGWRSCRSRPRGAARGGRRAVRTRATAVRTRSTGCISPSIVRIGLTFNVAPIHARGGADPAAAPEVLERVDHHDDLEVLAHRPRGRDGARQVRTAGGRVGRRDRHEAVAGAPGQRVDHDHLLRRPSRARSAGRAPARPRAPCRRCRR